MLTRGADSDGTDSTSKDQKLDFDWSRGRVTGISERKPVDLPTQPGLLDSLSVQVALMSELMAGRAIGGWQLNGIATLQTGTPFSASAPDVSATGGSHANRASCISNPYMGASADRAKWKKIIVDRKIAAE